MRDRRRAHLQHVNSSTACPLISVLEILHPRKSLYRTHFAAFKRSIDFYAFKMTKRASDQFMAMDDDELDYQLEDMPVTDSCDVVRYVTLSSLF
jgi:hypothetical protein